MSKSIVVNLSIEKSGGKEKLPLIIDALNKRIMAKYPDTEVTVRKGFFVTVDGIIASDADIETDIRLLLAQVRTEILG